MHTCMCLHLNVCVVYLLANLCTATPYLSISLRRKMSKVNDKVQVRCTYVMQYTYVVTMVRKWP